MIRYLDNAATTPLLPCARAAMEAAPHANPSSTHKEGLRARKALEESRRSIAQNIHCCPSEVYFTSGSTEACNWAIHSMTRTGYSRAVSSLQISPYEHAAVYENAWRFQVYDKNNDLAHTLADSVTGEIFPVAQLAQERRAEVPNALVFSDATAAVGHIPVDFAALGIDYMAFGAHKFGGPKGVGCLIARKNAPLPPLLLGGGQEGGRRSGTVPVELVCGMAAALEAHTKNREAEQKHVTALRDQIIETVLASVSGSRLNGPWTKGSCADRLPGNVNLSFDGVNAEALVMALSEEGICVSAGSACSAGKHSSDTAARRVPEGVRITLGYQNNAYDVQALCEAVSRLVRQFRGR